MLSKAKTQFLSGLKLFLSFLFLIINCSLFLTNYSFSQYVYTWYPVESGTTYNLNSTGMRYFVGDNGLVYYISSGSSFIQRNVGTTQNLNFIYYPGTGDSSFITGSSGNIIKIYNSGLNWVNLNSGVSADLFSICNTTRILPLPVFYIKVAVGSSGSIIISTNSGINWSPVNSPVSTKLNSITFPDYGSPYNKRGCIVGDNGVILISSNYGINWSQASSGLTVNLNRVMYYGSSDTDNINFYAVGDNGIILSTQNSGFNWSVIPSGTTTNLNSIKNLNGYIWVAGDNGTILWTTNFGYNWVTENTNFSWRVNDISGYFSDTIFAFCDMGKIFRRVKDTLFLPYAKLNANNINSYIANTGIFDGRPLSSSAGFEWPKGSNKFTVYTSGINLAARLNGEFRMAAASYKGELKPGRCINGVFQTDSIFKFYIIRKGDNATNNPDWTNWGRMVPYGAPFVDVNHNGTYEPAIDTPGVRNAAQTIFVCMTDADPASHDVGEGFGGGTLPMGAEIHMTAWAYDKISLSDVQFIKWDVINKNTIPWNNTYISIFTDPDLGYANDDFIGCDTVRKLGFCYNANNNDPVYGTAPPAVGFNLLKGCINKNVVPNVNLGLSSFTGFSNTSLAPPPCETDPNGEAYPAYLMMQGYKKDSTCWLDPTHIIPPNYYKKTKFVFSGDPESMTGWTEIAGSITNCNRDSSGTLISPNPAGDRRFLLSSGAQNLTVAPNDTQTIIIAQLIARGSSNLNSVTKLKQLSDTVISVYNSGFNVWIKNISALVPEKFSLYQNYPNPFNPTTKIRFDIPTTLSFPHAPSGNPYISLKIYDITGREIQSLVNEKLNPGTYEVTFDGSNFASGVYFYQLRAGDYVSSKKLILLK
jgi:photosystem II stability/assembly factor-like uncharacterized protein